MLDTIKYAIKVYCKYHNLALYEYAKKAAVAPTVLYQFLNHDNDMMIYNFEKLIKPLGYFLPNQSNDISKRHKELGWRQTLIKTGRQTAHVNKAIDDRKNVKIKKYLELLTGLDLKFVLRNNMTEPLFAKYVTCIPREKQKYAKQIEELEDQGIIDFNNEL